MTESPRMGAFEWLLLVVLGAVWGGSFFLAKIAVAEVPPFTLVFFRVSLAAVILWLFLKFTGRSFPTGKSVWLAFLLMGLINNVVPFSLLFWGQTAIAGGLASILNATTPIFTVLVAHWFTGDEKLTWNRVLGAVLGFAGVVVMLGTGLEDSADRPQWAMLACVGAAVSYAFASVFGRRFGAMGIGPVRVAFGQLSGSTLIMLPLVLLLDPPIRIDSYSQSTILSILALAVVCTAMAYILFFRILATGGATNLSLVTLLVPASAILLGALFLDERLGQSEILGMLLIGTGLLATDGRLIGANRSGS